MLVVRSYIFFQLDFLQEAGLRFRPMILAGRSQRRNPCEVRSSLSQFPSRRSKLATGWAEDCDKIILRRCPVCERDSIVGHGRRRKQAHDEHHDWIWIRRGRCADCGTTFTFLPLFSLPYTHFSLLARCQALLRRFVEHCSWEKASPKLKDPDRVAGSFHGSPLVERSGLFSAGAFLSPPDRRPRSSLAGCAGIRLVMKRDRCRGSLRLSKSSVPCVFEKNPFPTILAWESPASFSYAGLRRRKSAVGEDVETLRRRMPLLEYLRQHNWKGRPAGRSEYRRTLSAARGDPALVLCQHAQRCLLLPRLRAGRRSDSLRPVVPPICPSARAWLTWIHRPLLKPMTAAAVLEQAAAFYQQQLDHYPEATELSQPARSA